MPQRLWKTTRKAFWVVVAVVVAAGMFGAATHEHLGAMGRIPPYGAFVDQHNSLAGLAPGAQVVSVVGHVSDRHVGLDRLDVIVRPTDAHQPVDMATLRLVLGQQVWSLVTLRSTLQNAVLDADGSLARDPPMLNQDDLALLSVPISGVPSHPTIPASLHAGDAFYLDVHPERAVWTHLDLRVPPLGGDPFVVLR